MITVGLTGGIGSGKTFVSKEFELLGIPIYNSDNRATYLMRFNQSVRSKMIRAFGDNIYRGNELDKKYLSNIIFHDKSKLSEVNSIVHPAVADDFKEWVQENKQAKYVIQEAAILVETGRYKRLDYLIVVTAPEVVRINRVQNRDNMTEEQVLQRIRNQTSDKQRIDAADFVINNDGIRLVGKQVQEIHSKLLNSN